MSISHLVSKFERILTLLEEFADLLNEAVPTDEELSSEEDVSQTPAISRKPSTIWTPFKSPLWTTPSAGKTNIGDGI